MKQVKEKRGKLLKKTTIVPKMSVARQSYIKRFRRKIIREANTSLRLEIQLTQTTLPNSSDKKKAKRKRKMTAEDTANIEEMRRVRFDEDSNETFHNPRWIEDFIKQESEQQQMPKSRGAEQEEGKEEDEDED